MVGRSNWPNTIEEPYIHTHTHKSSHKAREVGIDRLKPKYWSLVYRQLIHSLPLSISLLLSLCSSDHKVCEICGRRELCVRVGQAMADENQKGIERGRGRGGLRTSHGLASSHLPAAAAEPLRAGPYLNRPTVLAKDHSSTKPLVFPLPFTLFPSPSQKRTHTHTQTDILYFANSFFLLLANSPIASPRSLAIASYGQRQQVVHSTSYLCSLCLCLSVCLSLPSSVRRTRPLNTHYK